MKYKTILFEINGFQFAEICMFGDKQLNRGILNYFDDEIRKKTKSKLIKPKIIMSSHKRQIFEGIAGGNLDEFVPTYKELYGNYWRISK